MMTIILFTPTAPHLFAEQLAQQGHSVYEAIAISEVYALGRPTPAGPNHF